MACLREVQGGREHPLMKAATLIGRAPNSDIVLPSLRVSARHASVTRVAEDWFVDDLGSSNGTFVNGKRIHERTRLRNGDRVDLYDVSFLFQDNPVVRLIDTPVAPQPPVLSSLAVAIGARAAVGAEAKLRAVLEISHNLGTALALGEVLPRILESLFSIFPQADRGFVLLRDPATGRLMPQAIRHRRESESESISISRTVIDHALQSRQAVLSADAGMDERFNPSMSIRTLGIRSVMCVPMFNQAGTPLGVIQLDTQSTKVSFHADDLDVMLIAGLEAARAIELAQLHQERRELEAASQIQRHFLPAERPQAPGLGFFDHYASAQQIGGDYYDYIRLPGQRLAVAIGDVAGKGVSAALLMARLSASVRFCLATEPTVAAAVCELNRQMIRVTGDGRFITFLVAVIDLNSVSLTIVNAGHLPPLRRRGTAVEAIGAEQAGIPLGVFDKPYEESRATLEKGDSLVLVTDGVTEAKNPQNEYYGMERLYGAVRSAPESAEGIGKAVLADVAAFAAARPASDDLTLVCVRREE
jgi:serine phosphatase RsbU (regulator of sigma subunit)